MRFLVQVNIPVEAGNAAARAGTLGETIQAILADQKPEAAYFTDNCGQRTGFIVLDMRDASHNQLCTLMLGAFATLREPSFLWIRDQR